MKPSRSDEETPLRSGREATRALIHRSCSLFRELTAHLPICPPALGSQSLTRGASPGLIPYIASPGPEPRHDVTQPAPPTRRLLGGRREFSHAVRRKAQGATCRSRLVRAAAGGGAGCARSRV